MQNDSVNANQINCRTNRKADTEYIIHNIEPIFTSNRERERIIVEIRETLFRVFSAYVSPIKDTPNEHNICRELFGGSPPVEQEVP